MKIQYKITTNEYADLETAYDEQWCRLGDPNQSYPAQYQTSLFSIPSAFLCYDLMRSSELVDAMSAVLTIRYFLIVYNYNFFSVLQVQSNAKTLKKSARFARSPIFSSGLRPVDMRRARELDFLLRMT